MDTSTLRQVMGNVPGVPYDAYTTHFNDALRDSGCTSRVRAAHFIGQVAHESGGLKYLLEIHDGSNYEGRSDLGNTQVGDGKRFRGRGIIQLTGRNWYQQISKWAHDKGMVSSPTYFIDNPAALEEPKWAFKTAVFYWTVARPQMNSLCDSDDLDNPSPTVFEAITRAVNGGTRGLEERRTYFNRARALGASILPAGATETTVNRKAGVMKNWDTLDADVVKLLNKHYTVGRGGNKIEYVVVHHNAGVLSIDQIWNVWQDRQASAHYQVTTAGQIGQLVYDSNTAWHAGNATANAKSIGIEFSNSAGAPNWPINDKTVEEGAHLIAAICRYYKLGRPTVGKTVRFHREFSSTSCPGILAPGGSQHSKLITRAQYWYDNPKGTTSTGSTTKEDTLSAAAEKKIEEIHTQLLKQWEQLGKNTPVDALALLLDQFVGPYKDEKTGRFLFNGWEKEVAGNGGKTAIEALAELQTAVKDIQDRLDKVIGSAKEAK